MKEEEIGHIRYYLMAEGYLSDGKNPHLLVLLISSCLTSPFPMAYHNPDADLRCPSPPVYMRLDESTQPDPQVGLSTTHRTTRYGKHHSTFLRQVTFDVHNLDPVLEAISFTSPRKTRYGGYY